MCVPFYNISRCTEESENPQKQSKRNTYSKQTNNKLVFSLQNKIYMKTKLYLLLFTISFLCGGCSKEDDGSNGMPQELVTGNAIILSSPSSMGFGYFRITGINEGQWAAQELSTISPLFSSATFSYTVTGENEATLFSTNTQNSISAGIRQWNVRLNLFFEDGNKGTFQLSELALFSGATGQHSGTFWIK